jgi:hypothetical protein
LGQRITHHTELGSGVEGCVRGTRGIVELSVKVEGHCATVEVEGVAIPLLLGRI